MDLPIENKLALVTGSTAEISYAIAASLAKEGTLVIINGRKQEGVQQAIAFLPNQGVTGKLLELAADFSTAEAATQADQFPDADILNENLGIYEPKPFVEITDLEAVANLATYIASPLSCATNGAALRGEDGVIDAIL